MALHTYGPIGCLVFVSTCGAQEPLVQSAPTVHRQICVPLHVPPNGMHAHVVPAFAHLPLLSSGPQHGAAASWHCELAVHVVAHFLLPAPSSKHTAFEGQHEEPQMLAVGQQELPRQVSAPPQQLEPHGFAHASGGVLESGVLESSVMAASGSGCLMMVVFEEHAAIVTAAIADERRWRCFMGPRSSVYRRATPGATARLSTLSKRLEHVLAKRLRAIAREKGIAISHVADRCGLAHSYFWQLLKEEASPTLAVVQRLAAALEVDPLELLREPPRREPKRR